MQISATTAGRPQKKSSSRNIHAELSSCICIFRTFYQNPLSHRHSPLSVVRRDSPAAAVLWYYSCMISAAAVLAATIAANGTATPAMPAGAVVHTAADLASAVYDRAETGRGFSMTGLVVHASPIHDGMRYYVSDSSGATIVETKDFARFPSNPVPGDTLEASGFIDLGRKSLREYAHCTNINVIAHGTPPKPIETTIADLLAGGHDFQLVTTRAKVRDVVHDEIDPRFAFIVIGSEGSSIPLVLEQSDLYTLFGDSDPMGAELEVTGVCIASPLTDRRQFGRLLTPSGPNSVRICEHASADPFDTPVLADFRRLQPAQIAALGRHRVTGRVLAVEKRRLLVIRTTDGRIHNVTLASGDPPRSIPRLLLPDLEVAYATTVHKSQGSEFGTVAVVLPRKSDCPLLTREILYTAVTRTVKGVRLWASEASVRRCVKNNVERFSGLASG